MKKNEIEKIITEINSEIKSLEKSKKIHSYIFEPKKPNKLLLKKNEKPHFFLIENGAITLLKLIPLSLLVFFTVGYDLELTLKISLILLLIILTYDYFAKFATKVKLYKTNKEFNFNQKIKFENDTILYNEKFEEYLKRKENILKYNSEIDNKIKVLKDDVLIQYEELTKDMSISQKLYEELEVGLIDFEKMNKRLDNKGLNVDENKNEINFAERKNIVLEYILKQSSEKQKIIYDLFKEIQKVQNSNLLLDEKRSEIKKIIWSNQSAKNKLIIGGLLGTMIGLMVFGTGGIGIVGLGTGIGLSGFLTGTIGGVLVSSIIQNFENKSK